MNWPEKIRQTEWFFVSILVFGIVIKIAGVFLLPVFHDVGWYRALTLFHDNAYMNLIQLEHPPLGYYFYLIALKILGIQAYVVRLVPFLFSLVELVMVYLLARKLYDKATAKCAVLLWSLTFFAYVNALSPEGDGSIMAVFSLMLFYFLYEYLCSKKTKFLFLTGIAYGLLLLIKVRAVLFLIPLVILLLFWNKNYIGKKVNFRMYFPFLYSLKLTIAYPNINFSAYKKSLVPITIILLVGITVFALFPVAVYLSNPAEFVQLIKQVVFHNTGSPQIIYKIMHPLIFLQVLVVISPLYFFLACAVFKKKLNGIDIFLLVWFVSLFLVLLILLPPGFAEGYPRYISFLLPPLLLLSAKGLSLLKYTSKNVFLLFILSLLLYLITHKINESAVDYWFYSSASMGVYKITQPLLVFYLAFPLILLTGYLGIRNKKARSVILSLFFITTFAFNLHFLMEPIVDRTHLEIITGLQKFFCKNQLKQPLFFWAEDLAFYIRSNGVNIKLLTNKQLLSYAKRIGYTDKGHFFLDRTYPVSRNELETRGGTVFVLYHPYKYAFEKDVNRQKDAEYLAKNCSLLKAVIRKTGRGEIWGCSPVKPVHKV